MKFSYWFSPTLFLLSAEIIPCVIVSPTPKGLPMAKTTSPSSRLDESPNFATCRSFASIFTTARSVLGSSPMIFALYSFSSSGNVMTISSAPSTTLLLVTM
jgi:hypothetical protein